jgi:tetratricopeptide (TPR) repeat protein
MLADLNVPQTDQAICEYALKHNPDDLRPRFPLELEKTYEGDFAKAASELSQVTEKHPEFAVAWAHYGRALVELGEDDKLRQWQQQIPSGTEDWAAYWVAAGIWAERNKQPKLAARAFWEAVRIDDCHGEALTHLAANLGQVDMQEDANQIARRAADVNAMHDSVEALLSWRRNSQQAAIAIAEAMSKLGRPWEAEAWARASIGMTQQLDDQARETHRRMHAKLTSTTPWQLPELSVLTTVDLSDLGEFHWTGDKTVMPRTASSGLAAAEIRFADEAALRGLRHICAISKTEPEASLWIYQSNAGGAGVIDYDLDGWPDLYLTVVDGQPLENNSAPNRLYRNLEGRFSDTTTWAGAADRGFSQGVAVGDYDEDGFPDLLVANIGANRLLRNNGDGTFQDVTTEAGLDGNRWTTSVAIADVDSDGIADLFEVNYASGESPFSQTCIDSDVQQPRSCGPLVFQAEGDRAWRGLGDGTFSDATDTWLSDQVPGHGLGLVIGQIDQTDGTDIYVANDMTANHFWSSAGGHGPFALSEQAAVRGLAVNSRSRSQASMGIAIGDGDLDGDLDIFLTHFTSDHNTFYEQINPGTWFDRTSSVGLAQPSTSMLAFGTEWIDADNSGSQELLVANGNVDDFSHQGFPLRMPAQLFVRTPAGVWSERDRKQLGPYFQRHMIGRALVTLDLNRDGLQDAVITHLYDPVAALVNETETESLSIRICLKGRQCARDAIGAIVSANVNGQERVMQLTAGDGFQCSNERCLVLGLGAAKSATDVTVQWPGGPSQTIGDLRGGSDYLVVQGEAEPAILTRDF